MREIIVVISFIILALVSCDRANKEIQTETAHKDTVMVSTTLTSSGQITNDSIVYDTLVFPRQVFDKYDVLTIGAFHSDEVDENADQREWLGVFLGEQTSYLGKTKVKLKRVYDPILDEEGEKTGWEVSTDKSDTCILLIETISNLKETSIQRLKVSKYIYPGDKLEFDYMGIAYTLLATGDKRKVQDNPEWFEVWNYKLYLTAEINGVLKKSLLVAHPSFDDNMTQILFAGDIDGDRILDLIIDTSRHYNATSPTIYLSRPSDMGQILKPIGQHTSVGC